MSSGIRNNGTEKQTSVLVSITRKIGVVDTGSSNLQAVIRSLSKSGFNVQIVPPGGVSREFYDCVVLPGVGNFGYVMTELENSGTASWLRRIQVSGTPILGICLGAQLLFESSEEAPGVPGLGFIEGSVKRLDSHELARVPHMGWNDVWISNNAGFELMTLSGKSFYFAHSFYFVPSRDSHTVAASQHGARFSAIVRGQNCLAIQFHPEKSGRSGQEMLRRSIEWLCRVHSPSA